MDRRRGRDPAGASRLLAAASAAIVRDRLLSPGDHVVVAVSGGADSVALLHALTCLRPEYGLQLTVCHVHHGLRAEADRDADFVRSLAARWDCPVVVERVSVPLGAGASPEEAARAARYAALARAADAAGATRLALGHTADDQAETVLMRVLQGAGPRGLAGMPVRRGRLIRPLLDVDRAGVLEHLAAHEIPWVEDATNRDPKLLRNRIRHELLPLLTSHGWPRIPAALRRIALASRETVDALDTLLAPRAATLTRPCPGGWTIDLAALRGLPPGAVKALLRVALLSIPAARGLRGGLRAHHLGPLHALLDAPVGARVRLPGRLVVERDRETLWVAVPAEPPRSVPLAVPGETVLAGAGLRLVAERGNPAAGSPAAAAREVWFDAEALPGPLEIRPRRAGDRLVPLGGDRAVRVTRVLSDARLPRAARREWPVLVARGPAGEEVLWVIGARRGRAAPVTPETRVVLRVRVVPDGCPSGESPGDRSEREETT